MPPVSLGFTPVTRRPYDAPLLRGVDGDTINIDRCRNRLEAGEFDEINSRCASICSTG
jgi:hypothetical protein